MLAALVYTDVTTVTNKLEQVVILVLKKFFLHSEAARKRTDKKN